MGEKIRDCIKERKKKSKVQSIRGTNIYHFAGVAEVIKKVDLRGGGRKVIERWERKYETTLKRENKRTKFKVQRISTMSLGSLKLLRKSRLAQAVLAHGRPKSA